MKLAQSQTYVYARDRVEGSWNGEGVENLSQVRCENNDLIHGFASTLLLPSVCTPRATTIKRTLLYFIYQIYPRHVKSSEQIDSDFG